MPILYLPAEQVGQVWHGSVPADGLNVPEGQAPQDPALTPVQPLRCSPAGQEAQGLQAPL